MTRPRNATSRDDVVSHEERELPDEQKERLSKRRTPPKKWADSHRKIQTAEYKFWYDAHRREFDPTPSEAAEDILLYGYGDGPANHSVYYPEEYEKELGDGAWVFVVDPPFTAQWSEFQVPVLSLWWARPHVLNSGEVYGRLPYQGVIQTPAGDLHLWPHEYTICNNPETFIGMEGTTIHSLGSEAVIDEEHLFYLMSRGISRHDATILLFGEIEQGDFAYVTFEPEIVEVFVGVGSRMFSTIRQDYLSGKVS